MPPLTDEDKQLRLAVLLMAERLTGACLQHKTPLAPEQTNAVTLFKNWYETAYDLLMKEKGDETA